MTAAGFGTRDLTESTLLRAADVRVDSCGKLKPPKHRFLPTLFARSAVRSWNNPHAEVNVLHFERPSAGMPYHLTNFVDGVGIFCASIAPTHFPEHVHPEISVDVCYENAACLSTWQTAGGRQLTRLLGNGNVSVIGSGQPHGSEWLQEAEHLIFYLAPAFVEQAARDLLRTGAAEIVENRTADDGLIRHLAGALRSELRRDHPPERLYVESLAHVLSVHLLRNYSARKRALREPTHGLSKGQLRRVVGHVAGHLAEDLTLSALAGVVGLSPYHFSRQFKRATGLTPHQYVVLRRVERARKLLSSTQLSVGEVASAVGFTHQSHLALHVRRHFGVVPSALRR